MEMNDSNDKLKKLIAELLQEILAETMIDEESTTAAVPGYLSAAAFSNDTPKEHYKQMLSRSPKGFEKPKKQDWNVNYKPDVYESINESKYTDFKNDTSLTNKEKIDTAISTIYKNFIHAEKLINMLIKLKNDSNISSDDYYKRTHASVAKIEDKAIKITTMLKRIK